MNPPDEITPRDPEPESSAPATSSPEIPTGEGSREFLFLPTAPDSGDNRETTPGLFFGAHGVRAGWRAAMYLALFALLLGVLQLLAAQARIGIPVQGVQPEPNVLFLWEFVSVLCATAAAALMARIEGRRFGDFGMPWSGALGGRFWKGALWGLAQITLLILTIAALGGYSFGDRALDFVNIIRLGLYWALFFLTVGVFEEFFFRGYLQFTVASGMGFWPAAILLSLSFAAVHLSNSGESWTGIPDLFAIALFFCLTLRRTGDLWFAIGFHAAFDFGESYLYSVPDSGLVTPGHLSYATLHGPAWLTGGVVGPEASVVSVVIIVATLVVFARVYPSKAKESSGGSPLPPTPLREAPLPFDEPSQLPEIPPQDAIPPPHE